MATMRDSSRGEWDTGRTREDIKVGSLQRIADACEKMCMDREKLERDYARMRKDRDKLRRELDTERRRAAAYKGVIKRLKMKLSKKLEGDLP